MKTNRFQIRAALAVAILSLVFTIAARGQIVGWTLQTFDYNTCGWESQTPVTLSFDPAQNYPGNGGGACRVSANFASAPFGSYFSTYGDFVDCCGCLSHVVLNLSNYYSVDFDLKWDNTSTVSLSNFNAGGAAPGWALEIPGSNSYSPSVVGYTNIVIPDAATNGWVHISAPINHTLPGPMDCSGILLEKPLLLNAGGLAAFWMKNVELISSYPATQPFPVVASVGGGQVTLRWNASPGATYTVQKSLDFIGWTLLTTNYPTGAAPGGAVSYTDPGATGSQAFYRVSSP